jgi:hypothetical protein
MPQQIIELFEREVLEPIAKSSLLKADSMGFKVPFPMVGEHVVRMVAKGGAKPVEVLLEIRNSKRARAFRRFCGELEAAIYEGIGGVRTVQKLQKAMRELFQKWSVDLDEDVRYKTRNIGVTFSKNILGLKMELPVKDPVLWSHNADLFFLNDIVRSARIDRAVRWHDNKVGAEFERKLNEHLALREKLPPA